MPALASRFGRVGRDRERGQALVELTLLLPLLLLIALGALDLGRAFFAYTAVANAAREGAMQASLRPNDLAGIRAAASAEAAGTLPGGVTTSVSGAASPGAAITVTVEHQFAPLTTAVVSSVRLPVRASATMMVQ